MTDQIAGRENARHEITGHENAGHDMTDQACTGGNTIN